VEVSAEEVRYKEAIMRTEKVGQLEEGALTFEGGGGPVRRPTRNSRESKEVRRLYGRAVIRSWIRSSARGRRGRRADAAVSLAPTCRCGTHFTLHDRNRTRRSSARSSYAIAAG
jgi:hypothetical protein